MISLRSLLATALLVGTAGIAGTTPVQAQGIDALRAKFMLPVPDIGLATEQGRFPRGAPGTSSGSPIAFGANWNDAFVGFGVQSPVRYSAAGDADGSASVGFGLGNSSNAVGLEVAVNALSSIRSGVGNRVGVGLKAHKLLGDNWGIALGVQGVQLNANADDRNSVYGVVTHVWSLNDTFLSAFQSLTWSAGAGSEAFQPAADLNSGKHGIGVFSSLALRTSDRTSVIADWSGQDLNLGFSFVPFKNLPLVLSPALSDITGASNDGVVEKAGVIKKTGMRFTLGVGFAFRDLLGALLDTMGRAGNIIETVALLAFLAYVGHRVWLGWKARVYRAVPRVDSTEVDGPVFDVRSHGYYAAGTRRIQGSQRLEPNNLPETIALLPEAEKIYLYCT